MGMRMPPCTGMAPPLRPVPAPRGTTGTPWRRAIATTCAACAALPGTATTPGSARSTAPSYS